MIKGIIVATLAIIWDGKDKYLLTKRYDPRNHDAHNKWQLPGGGLQFGETLEEGLKREIKEELGAEVVIVKQLPRVFEFMRINWHGVFCCFICTLKNPLQKIILNHEASKFSWFKKKELEDLDSLKGINEIFTFVT